MLGGSIALSVLAAQHDRLPADLRLARWMQDSPFPGEGLSRVVRNVTSTQVVLVTGLAAAALLWVAGRRRQALALAGALAVLPLAQHEIKEIVDRVRPSPELVEVRAGFSSPSFPAGHVMSPTVLYGYLLCVSIWPPFGPKGHVLAVLRAIAGTWSAVVLVLSGPANVYVGVHWPSDALGGYAWGVVLLLPAVSAAALPPWKAHSRCSLNTGSKDDS